MRHPEWRERLGTYLASVDEVPFRYGHHDCVIFAARVVMAVTGVDLLPAVTSRYVWTDALSATFITSAAGGLAPLVSEFLGDPTTPLQAREGDVVMAESAHLDGGVSLRCLSVMARKDGNLMLFGPGALGIGTLPLDCGKLAWRLD